MAGPALPDRPGRWLPDAVPPDGSATWMGAGRAARLDRATGGGGAGSGWWRQRVGAGCVPSCGRAVGAGRGAPDPGTAVAAARGRRSLAARLPTERDPRYGRRTVLAACSGQPSACSARVLAASAGPAPVLLIGGVARAPLLAELVDAAGHRRTCGGRATGRGRRARRAAPVRPALRPRSAVRPTPRDGSPADPVPPVRIAALGRRHRSRAARLDGRRRRGRRPVRRGTCRRAGRWASDRSGRRRASIPLRRRPLGGSSSCSPLLAAGLLGPACCPRPAPVRRRPGCSCSTATGSTSRRAGSTPAGCRERRRVLLTPRRDPGTAATSSRSSAPRSATTPRAEPAAGPAPSCAPRSTRRWPAGRALSGYGPGRTPAGRSVALPAAGSRTRTVGRLVRRARRRRPAQRRLPAHAGGRGRGAGGLRRCRRLGAGG